MNLTILPEIKESLLPLKDEELKALERSILEEGIRDELIVWDKNGELILVDGHHRYELAQKYNLEFKISKRQFSNLDEVLEWVDNNQLGRRNLTNEERSYLIGRMYLREKKQGERTDLVSDELGVKLTPSSGSHATAKKIAEKINSSEVTVRRAGRFAEAVDKVKEISPEVTEKILKGEVSDALTQLPKVDITPEIVEKIKETKNINQAKRQIIAENVKIVPFTENGKYRIVYADPPWKYSNNMPEYFSEQADHYPLMAIEEICALPIKDIVEDNAVLFLWVTSPILEESFQVIKSWGFFYKSCFVWDKIKHNMGHYNSVRHEFLLIATRGSCLPDVPKLFDSVISIERTEHSKKPEYFREIIDTIYPHGKRIELFARERVEGWDSYGNQLS